MPAVSKAQQRFMGMVRAAQKGELKDPSPEVSKAAKSMKKSDVKDFAKTKHEDLPDRKESEEKTAAVLSGVLRGYFSKEAAPAPAPKPAPKPAPITTPSLADFRVRRAAENKQWLASQPKKPGLFTRAKGTVSDSVKNTFRNITNPRDPKSWVGADETPMLHAMRSPVLDTLAPALAGTGVGISNEYADIVDRDTAIADAYNKDIDALSKSLGADYRKFRLSVDRKQQELQDLLANNVDGSNDEDIQKVQAWLAQADRYTKQNVKPSMAKGLAAINEQLESPAQPYAADANTAGTAANVIGALGTYATLKPSYWRRMFVPAVKSPRKTVAAWKEMLRKIDAGEAVPIDPQVMASVALGTSVATGLAPQISRRFSRGGRTFDKSTRSLVEAMDRLNESSKNLAALTGEVDPKDLAKLISGGGELVEQGGKTLRDVSTGAKGVKTLGEAASKIAPVLERTAGNIENTTQVIPKAITDLSTGLNQSAKEISTGLQNTANQAVQGVRQDVTDQAARLEATLRDFQKLPIFNVQMPTKEQLAIGGGLGLVGIVGYLAMKRKKEKRDREEQARQIGLAISRGLRTP